MRGKVSWLDSCGQESTIHITVNGEITLCGHPFKIMFAEGRWTPYRVSKKRGICKKCLENALTQHVNFKVWCEVIPERDFTAIPRRCDWRKQWKELEDKLRKQGG